MSSLDLTRDWLRSVLKPYSAKERLVTEVIDILAQRRTLSVKTDAFTYDNGLTALLLLLHGTLPITFRGATYQIPIHVWVPLEYPRVPPMAFVVPTKEMGVRKGREVEPGGRVTESVVDTWWNGWESKTVDMLLRQLTGVFSATPPVYSKPPETAGQSPNGMTSRPTSTTSAQAGPSGSSARLQQAQPPPPPARPHVGPPPIATEMLPRYQSEQTPPPHPFPQQRIPQPSGVHSRTASSQSPVPQSPPVPTRPGQIPPRPGSQGPAPQSPVGGPVLPQRPYIPPQHSGYAPGSPTQMGHPSGDPRYSGQVPPPHQASWHTPPPQAYAQQISAPQQVSAPHPAHSTQPDNTAPPVLSYHSSQPQQPRPEPAPAPARTHASPPPAQPTRRPMEDLLSSPDQSTLPLPSDPTSVPSNANAGGAQAPPPIPPSKPPPPSMLHLHSILLPHLQASIPSILHSLQSNRQHLLDRHEDLVSGEPAIRDEMARLEAVKKVCDSVGRKLEDAVSKGQERVAELEARGEVSVDEVVCGIAIVHNQLIDLVAEDNAIEDTIYHMTRALDNERIDLDRYMKSIRTLAREQYMKRALIERILQGMGQTQGW